MIISLGYRKNGFDAYGGKVLRKSDMGYWMDRPQRTDPNGVALGLDEDICEVESGFFDLLPTIRSVWMENPECVIHMTEKTLKLFRDNNVVLRGVYDSSAERLAKKHHLRFLHLDVKLASVGDYYERGRDTISIVFRDTGDAHINQDCACQGISAGNTGGGELNIDIPDDFWRSMTVVELADMCWHSGEIISNGKLAEFMKKAKEKNGFLLDFSK